MDNTDYLEVSLLPGKGRGYTAAKTIATGTVVHISDPYATTVSQEWIPETCMWCFSFSYPKKQKIKVIDEKEQVELLNEWKFLIEKTKPKRKSTPKLIFKDILFCSNECKNEFKQYLPYWKDVLAMNYRLELEYAKSCQMEDNLSTTITLPETFEKWVDLNDDEALSGWLEQAWDVLTDDLGLHKEIDDTDRAMCRLIGACILHKNNEDNNKLKFADLLVIQNNELIHFRTHFSPLYPQYPQQLPSLYHLTNETKKNILLRIIPKQVIETMAVYCFFARSLTTSLANMSVPMLENVNHALFRSIFFREKSNSFGLWEMSKTGENGMNDGVSDDLELLGWGIYPSAVYFNHSCDANVLKVRDGRQMKFIARRMIEKGEEACISYGNVGEELDARRSRLLEHYNFLCQCTRCLEDDKFREIAR